jgi:hypothetical protein
MMPSMRTTITLDPDVEALVKKQMQERGVGFKQAVNDAIRRGLGAPRPRRKVSFPTYPIGVPKVPGHKFLQLAGELEDEELLRKMRLGK